MANISPTQRARARARRQRRQTRRCSSAAMMTTSIRPSSTRPSPFPSKNLAGPVAIVLYSIVTTAIDAQHVASNASNSHADSHAGSHHSWSDCLQSEYQHRIHFANIGPRMLA